MDGEEDHYIIVACHDGGSSAIDVCGNGNGLSTKGLSTRDAARGGIVVGVASMFISCA